MNGSPLANLGTLRFFYEVARAGSIRKASDLVHTVPSAVSRQISLLEHELGTQLFERGRGRTGGVKLTQAGKLLMQRTEAIMSELDQARAEIDSVRSISSGRVTIGVTPFIAREFMPGIMEKFGKVYPGIDFSVTVPSVPRLVDLLLTDAIDAMIGFHSNARAGIVNLAEYHFQTRLAVSKDHPLNLKQKVWLSDCVDYPIAMPFATEWGVPIIEILKKRGLNPRVLLATDSFEALLRTAERGIAVGIIMGSQAHIYPCFNELRFLPLEDKDLPVGNLSLSTRVGRIQSAAVTALIELIKEEMESTMRHQETATSP